MSIITPRSHCFNCKSPIKTVDNIPIITYFLLRGKCNYCGEKFASRYVFIEVITVLLTLIIFVIYGLTTSFLIYLALMYLLIAITFVDIDHFIIPNGFIITGLCHFDPLESNLIGYQLIGQMQPRVLLCLQVFFLL